MLPYILVIFCICASMNAQEVQDTTITISLNKTLENKDRELHSSLINIPGSSITYFNFSNINKNVTFLIFQAHSHLYNITMCNGTCTDDFIKQINNSVTGTNIGLFSYMEPLSNFAIANRNTNDLKVLIAVHGYFPDDPVPGGCNLDWPVKIPPYVTSKVSQNRDYIEIAGAAPEPGFLMDPDKSCETASTLDLKFYVMYLPDRDFTIDTYFGGIRAMMNVDSILEHGEEIPDTHMSKFRRTVGAYPGTGVIFVALINQDAILEDNVTTIDMVSIYVPSVTYGCSPLIEDDCLLLGDLLSQILCASLLFVGLFVCYFGHKFFKTEMFIFGMLSGVIVSYILISLIAEMEQAPLLGASFLSGILFGFIWLTFWWFYGIPVFSVLLATLNFGFFTACVLYNQMPGGLATMMQDLNFWTLFLLVMFLTAVVLTPATYPANILCCSILGAYAAIYPIDYCLGSSLKYILINTVRRATVKNFYYAVLVPPFGKYDALMILLWVMLAASGFLYQHYHNRGKPPFPPPPRNIRERPEAYSYGTSSSPYIRVTEASDSPIRPTANLIDSERTPLLA